MKLPFFVLPCFTLLVLLGSRGFAGSPRCNNCYPSGGQRGTEQEVTFGGGNLADAKDLLFDEPGFTTTVVKAEAGKLVAKVKIAPEARLGEHNFRLITESGVSDLRLFYVTPFPLVEAKKDKDKQDQTNKVPLNTTVYGRTQNASQDHYALDLKKGQRLTAEVIGCRLQSQSVYDPMVRIEKADGTLLTEVDDTAFSRQDPVASIVAPEDGEYHVTIKESTNSGPGECHYLMHLGTYGQPLAVFPPGGPAGEELPVQLLGEATGPAELKVKLPGEADSHFAVFAEQEAPAPMPNFIRVSKFPNVLEAEPNDGVSSATDAPTLPVALNGVIEKKGDLDFFKFHPQKGQAYDISVFARQLRSPLDSLLMVYDAKGNKIAENDDDGMPDSHLRWTAPGEGEFYLSISDQLKRGGPLYFYRVEITPVVPKLAVYLPDMVINSSQERRAIVVPQGNRYASLVRLKRADVGGETQITADGLPAGVHCDLTNVDKTVDTIPVVFEAAPDAAPDARAFGLSAKVVEKDAPAVTGVVEHKVDIVENGNQKSFYSVVEEKLPIAVTSAVPVKVSLQQPKVPVLRNGSMDLKVKVERTGDFKGPVSVSLLYAPPGIGSGGPAQLKEDATDGVVTISCNDKAPLQKWKVCVVASFDLGKGPVWISSQLVDLDIADGFVEGQIQRTFIDQGDAGSVTVKLNQKVPFDGNARLVLQGLPQGVTAQEKEFNKDDKEVKFDLKADANAQSGQHRALFCQFKLSRDGEEMLNTFGMGGVLRVDKAAVAKNEPPK